MVRRQKSEEKIMAVDPKNPVETIEFIDGLLSGWVLHNEVMADGKVNFMDIPYAIAKLPALWKGFVGIDIIDDEMAVVNDEGKAKIKAKIAEFVIASDEILEQLIEELMALLLEIVRVSKKFTEYFEK
jgi:hypothetical protein